VLVGEEVIDESILTASFSLSVFLSFFGASVQAVSKSSCSFPLSSILSMTFCVIFMHSNSKNAGASKR